MRTVLLRVWLAGWHRGVAHPDYQSYGFDGTHITEDPQGGEWLEWIKSDYPEHHESADARGGPAVRLHPENLRS